MLNNINLNDVYNIILDPFNIAIFVTNLLIYIFASTIIKRLYNGDSDEDVTKSKIKLFRFFAILLLLLQSFDIIATTMNIEKYDGIFIDIGSTIAISYIGLFIFHICSHFIKKEFGDTEKTDEKTIKVTSYKSRMFNLLAGIFISIILIVSIVNVWEIQSVLGATGVIGVFVGFIVFTSGIWGQDLYNGIVMLYSKVMAEGNIIKFDKKFYLVYKVTPVETILLDIYSNGRTILRNKELGNKVIESITRITHLQGYRFTIEYKVGYNIDYSLDEESRIKAYDNNLAKMKEIISDTYIDCIEDEDISINEKYPVELLLKETGDHALHYIVAFYLKSFEPTNSTLRARKYLKSKDLFNAIFFKNSVKHGIDLSTPTTYTKIL